MLSQVTIIPHDGGNGVKTKNVTPNGNDFDPKKYGGYKQPSYGKYCLIKAYDKKNNEQIILQAIPKMYDNTKERMNEYLSKQYEKYEIINDSIKTNIIIEINKTKAYITGVTGSSFVLKNAIDRNFDINLIRIIHDIDKYFNIPEKDRDTIVKYNNGKIILADVECQMPISISLADLDYLYANIYNMFSKQIYAFSNITNIYSNLPTTLNDKFDNDDYKNKLYIINQLLCLLKTNERKSADLVSIDLSKNSGILLLSSKLPKGAKLVAYSITGLRKKVLYEVKQWVLGALLLIPAVNQIIHLIIQLYIKGWM